MEECEPVIQEQITAFGLLIEQEREELMALAQAAKRLELLDVSTSVEILSRSIGILDLEEKRSALCVHLLEHKVDALEARVLQSEFLLDERVTEAVKQYFTVDKLASN
jgi:hypothetical protein